MKTFNFIKEKIYLVARNMYEGYLIQQHSDGVDIVKVQPRELIISKKKMGEFRSLTVSERGLAEPGTYGELYDGNQVYELELKSDMSYKLRPRSFCPAGLGLASSIPVCVDRDGNEATESFDMLSAEFILRCKYGLSEYREIYEALEKVYDMVVANPSISLSPIASVEEAYVRLSREEEDAYEAIA